jgi:spore coat polysaccharide biosynthesis protein SpsF
VNVGIIIQARMGSTRLPGKVLKPIAGKALLDHVLSRLSRLTYPVKVIVATSENLEDDAIVLHCLNRNITVFRGSEKNVLDRYCQCARQNGFDNVVRLTADNPFTDIEELQHLIVHHIRQYNDYTHSFDVMPLGVGAEIFSFAALERSAREGHAQNHYEHVNEYIQENPQLFKIGVLEVPKSKYSPTLRLTIDTEDDYQRVCAIAEHLSGRWIDTEEIIRLCSPSA